MKNYLPLIALYGLSPILNAYEMHEWGTFTTVSGSNGDMLTGLHVEEEHLPPFVYSHVGMAPQAGNSTLFLNSPTQNQILVRWSADKLLVPVPMQISKGMQRAMLRNVTVKMETPVIYFYGDDTPKVHVKVGFNGGTISQWYPQRSAGDTPNKLTGKGLNISEDLKKSLNGREMVTHSPIDFAKPYVGGIEWDVEIIPKAQADPAFTFKPEENYTWIYPRVAEANMLKVGDEYEDYLFYRGIGNFQLPATFSVDSNETLKVQNNSKEAIPFAFAFENVGGKFRYKNLGSVESKQAALVAEDAWVTPKNPQIEVFQQMRRGLVAQGLSIDEANGMVKTWWKSYFNKPGLRVFWVVPQYNLEQVLPLTLDPKPEKSVRVIVGRADVLRPKFEQAMVASIGTKKFSKYRQDRFYLPYKNRLEQLIKKPIFTKFDKDNLTHISLQVTAKKGASTQVESLYLSQNNDVKLQHLPLSGAWEIKDDNKLQIGEMLFTLDSSKGLLTATAPKGSSYDSYEIQLQRVLN